MSSGLNKAFQGITVGEKMNGSVQSYYETCTGRQGPRSLSIEQSTLWDIKVNSEHEKDAELQILLLTGGESWRRKDWE